MVGSSGVNSGASGFNCSLVDLPSLAQTCPFLGAGVGQALFAIVTVGTDDSDSVTLSLKAGAASELTARGASLPYLGYIEVKVRFTEETAGVDMETTTLALVTPSRDGNNRAPLLLGTNTSIVGRLLESCKQKAGTNFPKKLNVNSAWVAAYLEMEASTATTRLDGKVSDVRLLAPVSVKKGSRVELQGSVENANQAETVIMIEAVEDCFSPGGLVVHRTVDVLSPGLGSKV